MPPRPRRMRVAVAPLVAALCFPLILAVAACGRKDQTATPKPAPTTAPATAPATAAPPPPVGPPATGDLIALMSWSALPDPNEEDRLRDPGQMGLDELLLAALERYAQTRGSRKLVLGRSLRQLGPAGMPALVSVLTSADYPHLRAGAAEILGRIGDPRAMGPLHVALFEDPAVSRAAAEALDRLDKHWRSHPAAKQMVGHLLDVLSGQEAHKSIQGRFWRSVLIAREEKARRVGGSTLRADGLLERQGSEWGGTPRPSRQEMQKLARRGGLAGHLERLDIHEAAAAAIRHLGDRAAAAKLTAGLKELFDLPTLMPAAKYAAIRSVCDTLHELSPGWQKGPAGREAVDCFLAGLDRPEHPVRNLAAAALGCARATRAATVLAEKWADGKFSYGWYTSATYCDPLNDHERLDVPCWGAVGQALVAIGDKRVLGVLKKMMDSPRADVASQAAAVFAAVGGDDAVAALADRVKKATGERAVDLVAALALTRSPAAVDALTQAYRGGGGMTYQQAEAAFEALEPYTRALMLEIHRSRDAAIRSMIARRRKQHRRARLMAVWALGQLTGPAAGQTLLKAVGDPDLAIRAVAIWGLEQRKTPQGVPVAIEALTASDPRLRRQAVQLLIEAAGARAVEPLLRLLTSFDPSAADRRPTTQPAPLDRKTLALLAEALGKLGDRRAVGPLVLALAGGVDAAFCALERIDPSWRRSDAAQRAVPTVIAASRRDDARVRAASMMLLGHLGSRKALKRLAEMMGQSDMPNALRRALTRLDPSWHDAPEVQSAVAGLIGQSQATDLPAQPDSEHQRAAWKVRRTRRLEAIWFLGQIADKRAVKPLLACFESAVKPTPPSQAEALLARRYSYNRDACRNRLAAACAEALGRIGVVSAAPALCAALSSALQPPKEWRESLGGAAKQTHEAYAAATARALGRLDDPRGVEVLLKVFQPSATALWREGGARKHWHWESPLPAAAAQALADRGDKNALRPLIRALPNCTHGQRRAVLNALGRLEANWRASPAVRETVLAVIGELAANPTNLGDEDDSLTGPMQVPRQVGALDALDPQWRSSEAAQAAVNPLHQRLKQAEERYQAESIVQLLGHLRSRTSVRPIRDAAARFDQQIYHTARAALRRIDPNRAGRP